ncbi:YciI family protein [Cupriavidus basilensis]
MLYLILLRYRAPLEELDRHLAAHRDFLHRHYAAGHFLLSGRQEPRVGGAILARGTSREEVAGWLAEDPSIGKAWPTTRRLPGRPDCERATCRRHGRRTRQWWNGP